MMTSQGMTRPSASRTPLEGLLTELLFRLPLDECAGTVLGKRSFEVLARDYLRRPETVFDQRRHPADAGVERRLFAEQALSFGNNPN